MIALIERQKMNAYRQLSSVPLGKRTAGNENTGLLKLFAILFMIVDHVSVVFFPTVLEMRLIGRIAFPLFAWCLCVGVEYTKNPWKYALRLLAVGVLSQPIYVFAMTHKWGDLNIFFELLLGLAALEAVRWNKWGSRYWGPAAAVLLACVPNLNYSYGWKGIVLILILYACRKDRAALAGALFAFCLFWGQGSSQPARLFGVPLPDAIPFLPRTGELLSAIFRIQFWGVLALPFIIYPSKGRFLLPQWVSYAAYPAHLLVLGVLRHWGEITSFFSR